MRHALWTSFALTCGAVGAAAAQYAPPGTGGVAALIHSLAQLGATKRVLVIGAHPDDEDTELLAILSRGMGVDAGYLSLTRGEGGQNRIGPELGPELGIIRTEELLAARRLDGARQFFTRAYDFGFAKTAERAWHFWPRDSLLADVLAVIRRFQPQIVVSIFTGTPRDGHGQHQVSGLLARQAFETLRDSSWGPVKLYRATYFDTTGTSVHLNGGALDPALGRSYHQLAMAGRSQHRSQDMGQLERPGPSVDRLAFVAWRDARRGPQDGDGLFAGVDTLVAGNRRYAALIDSARTALNPARPGAIVPLLVRARRELGDADSTQQALLDQTLATAAGVAIDGVADDGIVIPGERLQVEATVWNAGDAAVTLDETALVVPAGWKVEPLEVSASPVPAGGVLTRRFAVTVPPDAPRSQAYFLHRPLVRGLYDWSAVPTAWRGLPFEPPPVTLVTRLSIAGQAVRLAREVVYRYRDQGVGEVREPILVTRPFDLTVTPGLVVSPIGGAAGGVRRFTVTVTNRTRGAAGARIELTAPAGWGALPAESLSFEREDESKSVTVTLPLPQALRPGTYHLRAAALGAGGKSEGALQVINYPHIRPRAVARASSAELVAARLALPAATRVGYVRGASDQVPEALEGVGVPLELLSPDSLARGDLAGFDAIVIGSRAYETEPALVAANGRLLDYVRAGGLVIVQYQQYGFVTGAFAPYPLSIARPHDRVTDETAPVTLLQPASPVFHTPNELGPEDWQGWVQERGLYFAHTWDPSYTPLLELHDPGDPPLSGGLLVASVGRGTYVYTGLSFFRELPAGVVGAYRVFANLLALHH
ncbi:MAG TPA: PIG-L family deacetylase [Gemmatimonadales bacterium]|nr:PIG-L family deacetylase [Gemmatimonadales bacterium]